MVLGCIAMKFYLVSHREVLRCESYLWLSRSIRSTLMRVVNRVFEKFGPRMVKVRHLT